MSQEQNSKNNSSIRKVLKMFQRWRSVRFASMHCKSKGLWLGELGVCAVCFIKGISWVAYVFFRVPPNGVLITEERLHACGMLAVINMLMSWEVVRCGASPSLSWVLFAVDRKQSSRRYSLTAGSKPLLNFQWSPRFSVWYIAAFITICQEPLCPNNGGVIHTVSCSLLSR